MLEPGQLDGHAGAHGRVVEHQRAVGADAAAAGARQDVAEDEGRDVLAAQTVRLLLGGGDGGVDRLLDVVVRDLVLGGYRVGEHLAARQSQRVACVFVPRSVSRRAVAFHHARMDGRDTQIMEAASWASRTTLGLASPHPRL